MKIKKILTVFILLLIMISINTLVSADMGIPMISPYKATITNTNGAEVYKYEEDNETRIIEYGTEVEVMYEHEIENTLYAAVNFIENKILSDTIDIKLEDLTIKEDNYISKTLNKEEPIKFTVFSKNGVDIRKGPAEAYSKTGTTIPYGEEIVAYRENEVDSPWFFVNYNGVSGWICQLDSALVTKGEEIIMVFQDVELYDIEEEIPTEPIDTIPAGTLFKNYFISDPWSQNIIVCYEGRVGSIYERSSSKAYETPSNFKTNKNLTHLHLKPDEKSEMLSVNIPAGTILSAEYVNAYDIWAYVTYSGVSGYAYIEEMEYISEEEAPKNPVLPEIDESKVIDCEGKILNYDNKQNSEIIENNSDNKSEVNEGISEKNETPIVYTLDINQIVCICVITAIVTSLTCVVMINLLNRNKNKEDKDKNED